MMSTASDIRTNFVDLSSANPTIAAIILATGVNKSTSSPRLIVADGFKCAVPRNIAGMVR